MVPAGLLRRSAGLDDRDLAAVRRAGRRAAWLAAALVAASFLVSGGLVFLVVVTGQDRDAQAQLDGAVALADDVGDPPAGISLLMRHPDGRVEVSPAAPPVLPHRAGLAAVLAPGSPAVHQEDVGSPAGEFRIRTERRAGPGGGLVVQAALSLNPLEQQRHRLLGGLLAAGIVALVAAAALGAVSGRQTASGLVDALRRQRQFVADASHELRTPLTVLSTRAQLLGRHLANASLDEPTRGILAADVGGLLADSSRLADVVEDLLAATEPANGSGGSTDLSALAEEAVAAFAAVSAELGIRLESTRFDQGAAADRGPVEVAAPAPPLRRSLAALVDNALRHSPAGGTVTVGWGARSGRGVLSVSDTGPGIPDDVRAHVFDRFSSGDRRADDAAGAGSRRRYGLGLALVADTVHRFSGDVGVETGPTGTTFTLSLPRRSARNG